MKPPKFSERLGPEIYLCQECVAKFQKLTAQGFEMSVRELCRKCRPPGFDEPPSAKAN
jgi:hypothetical protein